MAFEFSIHHGEQVYYWGVTEEELSDDKKRLLFDHVAKLFATSDFEISHRELSKEEYERVTSYIKLLTEKEAG